ncbi:MAG TPA: alcohol dehydrogenase [Micrococcales bacterium]|uniref:aldo/keto reductase n=1 Tax=Miniimonas arenae TaxID=676201 RepID=UPI000ED5FA14|nr:aldo/keto reductase [Miniimonas arenae]HCX84252.1 alcohol dehydrogenase [Micrococcales bacterium]
MTTSTTPADAPARHAAHDPSATGSVARVTDPLDVGPVVLGGNVFGWTADADASHAVLDAFVAGGGRAVDTADAYSAWVDGHVGGESETVLGDWLAAHGARSDVVVATKVAKLASRPGLARDNVSAALEESLARLRTDVVDLYYAHADDAELAPEDIAATFGALVADGRVRAWGLSNFRPDRARAVVEAARAAGTAAPAYSQDRWSLVERGIEGDLLPTLLGLGLTELPYHALAAGFLTGKYRPGARVDSPRAGAAGRYLERPGALALLSVLDDVAAAHGVDVGAVALAWLRTRPGVGAPIASARSVAQLGPILASFTLELTADEVTRLTAASDAVVPAS